MNDIKKDKRRVFVLSKFMKSNEIALIGIGAALSIVFSTFKIYQAPYGGSVSLVMLPIIFVTFFKGIKSGFFCGMLTGLLKLLIGVATPIHWIQLLVDYPLAYGVIGLAGFLNNIFFITIAGGIFRFLIHYVSGIIFFRDLIGKHHNPFSYSFIYNASYIFPEIIIMCIIIACSYRKLNRIKKNLNKGDIHACEN